MTILPAGLRNAMLGLTIGILGFASLIPTAEAHSERRETIILRESHPGKGHAYGHHKHDRRHRHDYRRDQHSHHHDGRRVMYRERIIEQEHNHGSRPVGLNIILPILFD